MIATAELVDVLKAESGQESLIRSLERAAVAAITRPGERYFGATASITDNLPWYGGSPLQLSNEPAGALTLEEWNGSAWVAIAADRYVRIGRLLYLQGQQWRASRDPVHVRATYSAGYTPAGGDPDVWAAPEDVKQLVRMLTAFWYVRRGDGAEGVLTAELRQTIDLVLEKYR